MSGALPCRERCIYCLFLFFFLARLRAHRPATRFAPRMKTRTVYGPHNTRKSRKICQHLPRRGSACATRMHYFLARSLCRSGCQASLFCSNFRFLPPRFSRRTQPGPDAPLLAWGGFTRTVRTRATELYVPCLVLRESDSVRRLATSCPPVTRQPGANQAQAARAAPIVAPPFVGRFDFPAM